MKRFTLSMILLLCPSLILGGCATHKEQWAAYYTAVGNQIEKQPESKPLVSIEWSADGQRMTKFEMGNPYEQKMKIATPAPHPIYGVGIAVLQSPVLSIVGGGYAAKMLAGEVGKSAGDRYTNSHNTTGSHNTDQSVSASHNTPTTTTNTDSYNQSYADSNNQDQSVHDSYWTDSSAHDSGWTDNQDNRQNYDNPVDNRIDSRTNYENQQDSVTQHYYPDPVPPDPDPVPALE